MYCRWVAGWLVAVLALGCFSANGKETGGTALNLRGESGEVALLFPSSGCPCRYAPLAETLRVPQEGRGGGLAVYLAAPPSPPGSESVGLPRRWDREIEEVRERFAPRKEDLPFFVVLRAGRRPSLLGAFRVPRAPSDQKKLAEVVQSLAAEAEEP